jgi:Glycosidases
MDWKHTIHSEVNDLYVSNPYPDWDEVITVRLRFRKNTEVQQVFLRRLENGTNMQIRMSKDEDRGSYSWYSCSFRVNERFINYHFIIVTTTELVYCNRRGVFGYPPTEDHDFVILPGFANPGWVPGAVFYQIFVDRFRNGNPANDVQDGSYTFEGHPTKKNRWGDRPPEYREGFCLDFYGGDLEGVREMIPYFREIGVNALYLNPIFRARTNHKYDCTDYFNVDETFGGNEAFRALVQELHRNGMHVIVDVSINHTGSSHEWYRKALTDPHSAEHSYYYFDGNGTAKKWRGVDSLPQLNYGSPALRETIFEGDDSLVRHYIKEYGTDGWRFDVAMDTGRNDRDQFGNEIFARIRTRTKELKKDCYIIGEHWKDNISYLLGDQMDGMMNYFAVSRPLRCFSGETERYFVSEGILPLNTDRRATTGTELAEQITQHFARLPNQIAFLQFNLIDSHDIHRLHNNRKLFDFGTYAGAVIFMYLLPGTPNIYYGDEVGIGGDVDTVEACRYPMEWDRSKWDSRFVSLYTRLSFLKQSEKALQYGSWRILYSDAESCVLARWYAEKAFLGIISKNGSPKTIDIPVYEIGGMDGTSFTEIFSDKKFAVEGGMLRVGLGMNESMLLSGEVEA